MLGDVLAEVVGSIVYGAIDGSVWARRARKVRERAKVLGALRVSEGRSPGLEKNWLIVEAALTRCALTFEIWRLDVVSAHRADEQRDVWQESVLKQVSPVVLELRTRDALVEFAIAPEDVERVLDTLDPSGDSRIE